MKFNFFILLCIFLGACFNSKVPYGIIEPKDMENILWDQMKADAFTKEFISKNTLLNLEKENYIIQQKIFNKYKIDKKDFYKSYQYYLANDDLFKIILDSLLIKQTRIRDSNRITGYAGNQFQKDLVIRFALKGFVSAQVLQDTVPLFYPIHKPSRTIKNVEYLK